MTQSSSIRITVLLSIATLGTMSAFAGDPRVARYDAVPPDAYSVVAEVRAKVGKEDELRAITLPLVEQVRSEPNNLVYFLHEDAQEPGYFVFYEIFRTRADFEAHNATSHVQAWFARLPELADGGVKVTRMKILGNRTGPMP